MILLEAPLLVRVPAPVLLLLLLRPLEELPELEESLDWPLVCAKSAGSLATNVIPPIASDAIAMK